MVSTNLELQPRLGLDSSRNVASVRSQPTQRCSVVLVLTNLELQLRLGDKLLGNKNYYSGTEFEGGKRAKPNFLQVASPKT